MQLKERAVLTSKLALFVTSTLLPQSSSLTQHSERALRACRAIAMESASLLHGPSTLFFFALLLVFLQNLWRPSFPAAAAVTDPAEVESLKSIASKLGLKQWDFTVDPCNWNGSSPPYIECSCDNTSCHVTTLNLYNLNLNAEIPLEIVNLTQVEDLKMGLNLFSGSIPAQFGRLTKLQNIDLGINQLSGPVPPELGNLTTLQGLGIGSNHLSGALPKELGQLRYLTGIWMDATGLSGEIPVELGKLDSLKTVWMFGNSFSGEIPDIFGNMSQLNELRMYGNNFTGPIPTSLISLPSIQILSIGDLSNGGLIPGDVKALKNVQYLSLRHNGLSGSIPEGLGSLSELVYLDLSFNNLTGRIPTTFAALTVLSILFLGSNNLQGNISMLGNLSNLKNLDVSNNQLSGALPAWVNESSLEVNLLWNFFEYSKTENRLPYAMFNCLDNNSPCDQTASGPYGSFAINCGGPQVTVSSTQTTYSADSENLGNSSVFKSSKEIWGVSNTGYDDTSFSTMLTTTSIVQGTSNQELYKTARGAASSLRYYGTSLINGLYNVELHFAEIVIPDNGTWQGTGQRIFDVHIQGLKVLKDFNIRNIANGSYKAVVRNFTTNVTNNVLEVHLLWSGKGTCCAPTHWTYGPLISAIRVKADFYVPPSASTSRRNIAVIVAPILAAFVTCFLLICFLYRRGHLKRKTGRSGNFASEDFSRMEAKPHMFTFNELKVATEGFHSKNKLGSGGFGTVYKGHLLDGTAVAVKQLTKHSEKRDEFLNEVATISTVQHRNLVKLLGCCVEEGQKLLVLEFLVNNSLSHTLFGKTIFMDWPTRFNICLGIARGLMYMHEESRTRIVHRDIKASNILLDENLTPKIADFGLAKLYQDNKTHVSTRIAGTVGYLAPEYIFSGKLTEKADVYSFGILLLEIVTGKSNMDTSLPNDMGSVLEWTWQLHEENKSLELADESLKGEFSAKEVERVILVALLCTQAAAAARPKMSEALAMLNSSMQISCNISRPHFFSDLKPMKPKHLNLAGTSRTNTASSNLFTRRTYSVADQTISEIEPR